MISTKFKLRDFFSCCSKKLFFLFSLWTIDDEKTENENEDELDLDENEEEEKEDSENEEEKVEDSSEQEEDDKDVLKEKAPIEKKGEPFQKDEFIKSDDGELEDVTNEKQTNALQNNAKDEDVELSKHLFSLAFRSNFHGNLVTIRTEQRFNRFPFLYLNIMSRIGGSSNVW